MQRIWPKGRDLAPRPRAGRKPGSQRASCLRLSPKQLLTQLPASAAARGGLAPSSGACSARADCFGDLAPKFSGAGDREVGSRMEDDGGVDGERPLESSQAAACAHGPIPHHRALPKIVWFWCLCSYLGLPLDPPRGHTQPAGLSQHLLAGLC